MWNFFSWCLLLGNLNPNHHLVVTGWLLAMNHHGVWLRVQIEADELIFKPTIPLREDFGLKPRLCDRSSTVHLTLSNPEGRNAGSSSSVPSTPVLDGGAMRWLVITGPFHNYRRPGLWRTWGYLAFPGRAALFGGPIFCHLLFFLHGFSQNEFQLLSFLLVVFAIDCLWRYRVKSRFRFWQDG